jgi:hypothetical protein
MVLMREFRPKREKVTGGWRKLHNKGLLHFYCLSDIIKAVKSRGQDV